MTATVAWGVDIGKSSLKAVKIRNIKGELEIESLHYFQYDKCAPGMDGDNARREAIDQFVQAVGGAKKIKKETVAVCLPAQTAFSRFLELPPVDEKRIDETIALEAKQQIPFPIDAVNWGYHKINRSYAPGEQHEIGIFAIKKDMVEEFVNELKVNGIEPEVLTIAPLALYNYAIFDCKTGGGTIVLDIGADQTNLVIVDDERMWIRNLPIAGNDITKSLQDKFNIPFKEAEKLKKNARKSSNAKKIFSVMQPVLKDFTSEVQRSIGFYKSKQKDADLSRILLTGNGTKLFNLTSYLSKELDAKIRRVQQLNRFSIDPEADMELLKTHLPSFSVAFGLAIQAVGEGKANVNLLPREEVQRQTLQAKAPMILAGAGLALVGAVVSWFLMTSKVGAANDSVAAKLESRRFKDVMKANTDMPKELDALEVPIKAIQELEGIFQQREWASAIYERIARAIPDASQLPWRDPADPDQLKPPAALGENPKAEDLQKAASIEMAKFNGLKIWTLGLNLERQVVPTKSLVYYRVRLTVAKLYSGNDVEDLNTLKNQVGAKVASEFGIKLEQLSPTDKKYPILDRTTTAAGQKYYAVSFEWGYPVDTWLLAAPPPE